MFNVGDVEILRVEESLGHGFQPNVLDNKEHRLDVKMKQAGQTGRARRSYIASAERLSGTK